MQAPSGALVVADLVTGLEVGLADVVRREVRRGEKGERTQCLVTLPNRVAAFLRKGVDEAVEGLGVQIVVADDGPAVSARNMRDRRELPQQILELRLTLGARTAKAFDDAAAYRLPEVGGVEQFDEEEVAAGGLDALADLPEQVSLARPARPCTTTPRGDDTGSRAASPKAAMTSSVATR